MSAPDETAEEPVVLDVMGPERSGKSDFACSISLAHSPTLYLALDYNYKGPVKRHRALGAKIDVEEFFYTLREPPPDSPKVKNFENRVNDIAKICRPVFQSFKDALWEGLSEKSKYKSIVIDNGTSLHLLCRLALFGYIHKVPTHLYAKRTLAMSTILNQVRYSGKHVVWIHRQAESWENNQPTGNFERAGAYKEIAYEVSATLQSFYDDERRKFGVEVLDSTFSQHTVGKRFFGSKRTFSHVASVLLSEEAPQ